MIGTEFFHGQGFGNQLFCYVTARSIALDNNTEFASIGQDLFGAPRWNEKGAYFMDVDLGLDAGRDDFTDAYNEKSTRLHLDTCRHDCEHGCDISLVDKGMQKVKDGTLIGGNMQSEEYFIHRKAEVKEWLKVKPEYESDEFTKDNLCIINVRGGEYVGLDELYLNKKYWQDAIKNMKKVRDDMEFMIITDDVKAANKLMPEIEAKHFTLDKDYVSIKNAKYLILSNSSFAFFPAFTSDTVEYIIAPKYWARHNVSTGYWATGQNIYTGWHYQDRKGRLFSAEKCRGEFKKYKDKTGIYKKQSQPIKYKKSKYVNLKNKILRFLYG